MYHEVEFGQNVIVSALCVYFMWVKISPQTEIAGAVHCWLRIKHLMCWSAHTDVAKVPGASAHVGLPMQQMQSKRQTLMDSFEYVMFGRIFKYEDTPSGASNQVRRLSQAIAAILRCIPHSMSQHATRLCQNIVLE